MRREGEESVKARWKSGTDRSQKACPSLRSRHGCRRCSFPRLYTWVASLAAITLTSKNSLIWRIISATKCKLKRAALTLADPTSWAPLSFHTCTENWRNKSAMPLKCSRGKSSLSVINRRCHQMKEACSSRVSYVRAINLYQFLVLVSSLPFSFLNASLQTSVEAARSHLSLSLSLIVFLSFPLLLKIYNIYIYDKTDYEMKAERRHDGRVLNL